MSWQDHVDNSLLGLNQPADQRRLDKALIVGVGGDVWAASPGFALLKGNERKAHPKLAQETRDAMTAGEIKEYEAKRAAPKVDEFTDIASVLASGLGGGIEVQGEKYVVTQVVKGESIYARKGLSGIIVVTTKTAVVIGFYDEPKVASNAVVVLDRYAEYMKSVNC